MDKATRRLKDFLSMQLASARPSKVEQLPEESTLSAGDLVFIDADLKPLRRLALIAEVYEPEKLVRVFLCSNDPEYATDICPVFESDETSFAPTVVVHAVKSDWVFSHQVSLRVGHIDSSHLNAIEDAFRTEGESLDGLRKGRPLPITSDPRHETILQDAEDLKELTSGCWDFRNAKNMLKFVDPEHIFGERTPDSLRFLVEQSQDLSLSQLFAALSPDHADELMDELIELGVDMRSLFRDSKFQINPVSTAAELRHEHQVIAVKNGVSTIIERSLTDGDTSTTNSTIGVDGRRIRIRREQVALAS